MPNILQTVLDAGPLYKTKFEVSGEDGPLIFLLVYIKFKMTVNQLLVTSIGLILGKPC